MGAGLPDPHSRVPPQQFVQQHTIPTFTWIGLSDAKGKWEWVDGTPYILDPR